MKGICGRQKVVLMEIDGAVVFLGSSSYFGRSLLALGPGIKFVNSHSDGFAG